MLMYYQVNKLQKILVTAWRRRKRLTVAGFFSEYENKPENIVLVQHFHRSFILDR